MTSSQGQVNAAIAAVAAQIRDSGLRPGDKLPSEMDLTQTLGVSRPVVREALRALSALRIINQQAGRRSEVGTIDAQAFTMLIEHGLDTDQLRLRDIYEVRRTLEMRIAALAAVNRTSAQASTIMSHAESMTQCVKIPDRVMEHDMAFHIALAAASHNVIYCVLLEAFVGTSQQVWPVVWRARQIQGTQAPILELHTRLAEAVLNRDPALASALMADHFDDSVRTLDHSGIV